MARLFFSALLLLSASSSFGPVEAGRWGVTVPQTKSESEGLEWLEGGRTVKEVSVHSGSLPLEKPDSKQVAEVVRGIIDMRYLDHIHHQYHTSHEAHIRHQAHLAHLAHIAEHDTVTGHAQLHPIDMKEVLPVAPANDVYGECSSPTSRCDFYFQGSPNSVPVLNLGSGVDHVISTAVMDSTNKLPIEVDSTGVGAFQCTGLTSYNTIGNQFYISGTPGLLMVRNFNEVRIPLSYSI